MNPLDDTILKALLTTDNIGKVLQREDDRIEYKEIFDNDSKAATARYAKEMAAFYNHEGGYLIFGVSDDSMIVGLTDFVAPDNAELANDVKAYFSPVIRFQSKLIKINNLDVFVIYVEKRSGIPTVCIKAHPNELKDATIYWRYSAQSAPIEAGDLINLLNGLRGENSKELVDIVKKDFRSKFRPRLQLNGVSKHEGEVKFRLENNGEIAHVDYFEIIESNAKQIFAPTWKNHTVVKKESVQAVVNSTDTHWKELQFTLAINYHDAEDHQYQDFITFNKGESDMKSFSK